MRAIEQELLKSSGGHRPQPILLTFLDWPMGRVDTSQLVHACHKPLSCFPHKAMINTSTVLTSGHVKKTIDSVVSLLRFTAYWAAKSDN